MQAAKLRWQDSMDGLGVVAWTAHARTWTVTSIGRNVESVFGYSRRAWRTKGFWLSHIDSTDRELVGEFLEETLDRRRSSRETCEYRFLDANGAVRWVRTSVARRTMRASAVSGFHLDITESRTARESLSVVDEQYQFALRVAGVRIWEHDAADVESMVPAPIAALAGLGAGRPVTLQQWLERVHPRDRERVLAHANQTRVTAPAQQGGPARCRASSTASATSTDRFGGSNDRGEGAGRRRSGPAPVRYRRRRDGSHSRADGPSHGRATPSRRLGIDSVQCRGARSVWRHRGGESCMGGDHTGRGRPGERLRRRELPERRAGVGDAWEQAAARAADGIAGVLAGTIRQFVFDYTCPVAGFDAERWMRMRALPLHRPARGAIIMHDDITDRMTAEWAAQRRRDDLTHMQRLATLGELATSIAHELNQPLAAIMASASTARRILRDRGDLEMLKPIIGDVLEAAARAADVVRRARAMVRHDDAILETLSVNEIVSGVARLMASDLVIRQVALRLDLDPNVRAVVGDRVQLQQVLLNLLLNAVDALDELPRERRNVIVTTRQIGDGDVELRVRDTGNGIPPGMGNRVFEPFVTTKRKGTGLGLAIVRAIVHAHGGRVLAETPTDGGASFRVILSAH